MKQISEEEYNRLYPQAKAFFMQLPPFSEVAESLAILAERKRGLQQIKDDSADIDAMLAAREGRTG